MFERLGEIVKNGERFKSEAEEPPVKFVAWESIVHWHLHLSFPFLWKYNKGYLDYIQIRTWHILGLSLVPDAEQVWLHSTQPGKRGPGLPGWACCEARQGSQVRPEPSVRGPPQHRGADHQVFNNIGQLSLLDFSQLQILRGRWKMKLNKSSFKC